MYEKRGSYQFHYRYDAFGNLAGITREDASGSLYRVYVLCNSRGDVLELRNQNGTVFAKYVYDAWGNVLHVLNSAGNEITSTTNLANQNPFRYRGYYYDSESGMYYLQSRYYDPVTGRFLNADNIVTTEHSLVGTNVFAYCGNNPVVSEDETGHFWDTVFDVVSIVVSIIDVVKHPKKLTSWLGLALDIGCAVVPFATGGGTAIRAASKADDIVDSAKQINRSADMVSASKKGWRVGDNVSNLTKAGNKPSWSTVRQRYWKNEAHFHPEKYSLDNLERMKKGLAAIGPDGFSMELHHPKGRNGENFFVFEPLSKTDHIFEHLNR